MKALFASAAIAATVILAHTPQAHAEESGTQWFTGIGVGQAWVEDYALESDADSLDDTPTAWRVFAGWRFHRHFAVGLGYVDLGEVKASGASFGGFSDRIEVEAVELLGIGLWPITPAFELYGIAGYVHWEQDVTQTVTGVAERFSASGQSASLGGGAQWWISDPLAAHIEWRRYAEIGDFEKSGRENRWDVVTLGLTWRF